jgi:hypothetical protein
MQSKVQHPFFAFQRKEFFNFQARKPVGSQLVRENWQWPRACRRRMAQQSARINPLPQEKGIHE